MLRKLLRPSRRVPLWLILCIAAPFILEVIVHRSAFRVPVPSENLDKPFYTECQVPDVDAPRENAAMVMLARNRELAEVNKTISSIHDKFNRWFNYPIIFFNNESWDPEFIREINKTAHGNTEFHVISDKEWYFPKWMDPNEAKGWIEAQGEAGIPHAGEEGYHHMCRFFSGAFYEMETLERFKWYWRLEPDVDFSCHITYDPFREMAKHGKIYGFTVALWEVGLTVPNLFRYTNSYREANQIPASSLWKATVSPSYMPWPFRKFLSYLDNHDNHGDEWSLCHYWSNFEIADMDFFRQRSYMDYFRYLDNLGGFYSERWGDAAVHSLALQMLADPARIHHFADIGYRHDRLYQCPSNAPGGQMEEYEDFGNASWTEERPNGIGCRCECNDIREQPKDENRIVGPYCLNRLQQPNHFERPWFPHD